VHGVIGSTTPSVTVGGPDSTAENDSTMGSGRYNPVFEGRSGNMVSVTVYRDSGVVLRVTKLGEADRIVTLLTRREGRVRAVAKGVRRTKSRFGGRLEPFSHVDLQLYAGRNLDIVTQAVTLDSFGSVIAADYSRYTAATAIVETVERLTSEEREPSLKLYLLLVSVLRALAETGRDPSLLLDAFLVRSMSLAGWAPALSECARCGEPGPHAAFHIPSGGLLCGGCRSPGAARPAPGAIALMAALASGDWPAAEGADGPMRREASGLVAALLQWHIERGLKSLPLVDRGSVSPSPELRGYPAARSAALSQARADGAVATAAIEIIG
jgi:DNA repair protein RecO (recombination protein O)